MKVWKIERGIQRGVISLYGYNILSLDMEDIHRTSELTFNVIFQHLENNMWDYPKQNVGCHVKVNNGLFDQLQLHLGFSLSNYAGSKY